jgi:hypothetical protein
MAKIAKLTKPTDVSENNLEVVIQTIHDKINELITSINAKPEKAVPKDTQGSDSDIKIIDDQTDGKVKIGIKAKGTWYTVNTEEGG